MPRPSLQPATRWADTASRTLALTALCGLVAALVLSLLGDGLPAGERPPPAETGITPSGEPAVAGFNSARVVPSGLFRPAAHHQPVPMAGPSDPELERQLERHVLNALLVPVLDDEADRPSWADPSLSLPCGPATAVQVDHQPLQPGTPQSGRAFVLSWTLDHCVPFGVEGPVLTGKAELDVFRDDEGLTAIVRLQHLQVERQGRQTVINKTLTARMP